MILYPKHYGRFKHGEIIEVRKSLSVPYAGDWVQITFQEYKDFQKRELQKYVYGRKGAGK
jgi:hypothetical protein